MRPALLCPECGAFRETLVRAEAGDFTQPLLPARPGTPSASFTAEMTADAHYACGTATITLLGTTALGLAATVRPRAHRAAVASLRACWRQNAHRGGRIAVGLRSTRLRATEGTGGMSRSKAMTGAAITCGLMTAFLTACGSDAGSHGQASDADRSPVPTGRVSQFSLVAGVGGCPGEVAAQTVEELSALTEVPLYVPTARLPTKITLCNGLPSLAFGSIDLDLVQAEWVPDLDSQWTDMVETKQGVFMTIAGQQAFVHKAGTNGSSITMVQLALGDTWVNFTAGPPVKPSEVIELADSLSLDPVE